MVDAIPTYNSANDKSKANVSCGEESVAPWGSLYPVYSKRMKRIYKNMVCALADGATDAEAWDAILVCDSLYKDTSNFVIGLDSDQFPHDCSAVEFVYGGNIEELDPLKCFDDFIDTCLMEDFNIPDSLEINKHDVISMCESGVMSPYRVIKNYANVFCFICDDNSFTTECEINQDSKYINARGRGFLGLIDDKFIKEDKISREEYPLVCSKRNVSKILIATYNLTVCCDYPWLY